MGITRFLRPEDGVLWRSACEQRARYWGNAVFLRGIIEFSNHCRQNCLYCGLRKDNRELARYRMSPDAILSCAAEIRKLGFGTVVLQAGEDPGVAPAEIARAVSLIHR